ncbi:hypothetical protein [Rosistilla oblonga]|uniref:hypothetical protein n=1 Tax=Rosistilla oblonga TaxID=2527990 RepID=UPI0011A9058A|nr:hypothetical protein [Rosistilla oblonga]
MIRWLAQHHHRYRSGKKQDREGWKCADHRAIRGQEIGVRQKYETNRTGARGPQMQQWMSSAMETLDHRSGLSNFSCPIDFDRHAAASQLG